MSNSIYRYVFSGDVSMDEVEASLVMAIYAVESLHGAADTRLEASHAFDRDDHKCVIDARTDVGRDLARLFVGFVSREFGEYAFSVERVDRSPSPATACKRHKRTIG